MLNTGMYKPYFLEYDCINAIQEEKKTSLLCTAYSVNVHANKSSLRSREINCLSHFLFTSTSVILKVWYSSLLQWYLLHYCILRVVLMVVFGVLRVCFHRWYLVCKV